MSYIPSLVRTEESGDEGRTFDRGLFGLGIGSGLRAGGVRAGSIFQGETWSGLGIAELSSHRTLKTHSRMILQCYIWEKDNQPGKK